MEVLRDHSLKPYNSFGVDVWASHYVKATNLSELREATQIPIAPKLVLGGGSNILFSKNYKGLVIHNAIPGMEVSAEFPDHVIVRVGAGVVWHELVKWSLSQNFGGLENLSLIPGTVGAAPIQNIGAYGVEFDQVFESLEAVELASGDVRSFDTEECAFGYRTSIFKHALKGKYAISHVSIRLSRSAHILNTSYGAIQSKLKEYQHDRITVQSVSRAVVEIRQSKLPDPKTLGNAGSFFKNPVLPQGLFASLQKEYPDIPSYQALDNGIKIPAAWLIEKCGWKGFRQKDAGIYEKHALVLVNHGTAKGEELYRLALAIQASVQKIFQIELEPEVTLL